MKTVWLRPEHHKDLKKKKDFQDSIVNSRVLVDRFLELLDSMKESLERDEAKPEFYNEGYMFKQAYANGKRSMIKEIEGLFDFENTNHTTKGN